MHGPRLAGYSEDRGNGTPVQVNSTEWTQVSGEVGGAAGEGAWLVRGSAGSQKYFQTFSAILGGRVGERLVREQTTEPKFGTASGQYTRAIRPDVTLLVGAEWKKTSGTLEEFRQSFAGVRSGPFFLGGDESSGGAFGRVAFVPREELTVVVGARVDAWRSNPTASSLPSHSATFLSPKVSASWRFSDEVSFHGSAYRAHRTPTLNELHRGFRVGSVVTNANPELDPERLTGFEGGVLYARGTASARVTGFYNTVNDAVANVTLAVTPALITRQRQNTNTVRAAGVEFEASVRPDSRWAFTGLIALTHSAFTSSPDQPMIEDNRVPQVPLFQFGGSATYVDPRGFTGAVQARILGAQFDDDLNNLELGAFGVVDLSASQVVMDGVHVFLAIENLFDKEYDIGRTPVRTVGWPRSARIGVRLFLP